MSLQVFQTARAALEATRGTPATPTRILYAEVFEHGQTIQTIRPETLTGTYEGFPTASTGYEENTFHESGRESFEDMVWRANLFFAPLGTASGTAGAAYTYAFEPSGTADNVKTMSVQMGWNDTIGTAAPGVSLSYLLGETLTYHWEKNDEGGVTFDATYLSAGTATQGTAFTGVGTARATTLMSALTTTVSLDATTIGSTVDTSVTAVDWTLQLQPVPFRSLNGSAGATAVYRPKHRTWTAQITRQYANKTEWSIYQTKALRKVRILSTATGGTAQIDLYGVYTNREWSEVDGIVTEVLTLEPGGTADPSFRASVVTTFGTLI